MGRWKGVPRRRLLHDDGGVEAACYPRRSVASHRLLHRRFSGKGVAASLPGRCRRWRLLSAVPAASALGRRRETAAGGTSRSPVSSPVSESHKITAVRVRVPRAKGPCPLSRRGRRTLVSSRQPRLHHPPTWAPLAARFLRFTSAPPSSGMNTTTRLALSWPPMAAARAAVAERANDAATWSHC